MKVGYYQFRPQFGKVARNLLKVVGALKGADAELIVLPELPFTGYYFRDREEIFTLAEDPTDSPTVDALVALCRDEGFHIVTGFTERRLDKVFNSALLIGPDGLLHVYRKLHLFNDEKNWFNEGDIPLQVNTVNGAKIGILVCFDWAFPETARILALDGAEILCQPANLVLSYCQSAMLTRCLENHVFAVTANRYGADKRPHGSIKFTGKSQIAAPKGKLLHRARAQRDELFIMDLDPNETHDKHITPLNDLLADRRPPHYGPLLR